MSLIIDIETSGLPVEQLEPIFAANYTPLAHPGEFDQSSVKTGHLKDPAKIEAKLQEARDAHAALLANHGKACTDHRAAALAEFVSRAALNPVTGCVLAVGVRVLDSGKQAIVADDEATTLQKVWSKLTASNNSRIIGHNIKGFDLPFMMRRSWILQVDVPNWVFDGRFFHRCFIDTRDLWLCGQPWGQCESSLGVVGQALGLGGKTDGVSGGDFSRLWNGTPEERALAKEYLLRDLELTAKVAQRMGVVS